MSHEERFLCFIERQIDLLFSGFRIFCLVTICWFYMYVWISFSVSALTDLCACLFLCLLKSERAVFLSCCCLSQCLLSERTDTEKDSNRTRDKEMLKHKIRLSEGQEHDTEHTATHCNTLQHTATHCNTLQHRKCRNMKSDSEKDRNMTQRKNRHRESQGHALSDFTRNDRIMKSCLSLSLVLVLSLYMWLCANVCVCTCVHVFVQRGDGALQCVWFSSLCVHVYMCSCKIVTALCNVYGSNDCVSHRQDVF